MDFVDLDKVLDEFEEEEKAALSIVPGQELKPSGYIEFLEKHQAQEWESFNSAKYAPSIGYSLEGKPIKEPVNVSYDEPYDSLTHGRLGFIQDHPTNNITHYGMYESLDKYSFSKDELPHGSDQLVITGKRAKGVKEHIEITARRGTIASQTAEVQTDALTPNSEQELSSLTYPKSDIIVDGHGDSPVYSVDDGGEILDGQDANDSPIYASVDTNRIMSQSSQSPVLPANYVNVDKANFPNLSHQDRNSFPTDDHNSYTALGQNGMPDQIVGFHDGGEIDDDEVNMYLNELNDDQIDDLKSANNMYSHNQHNLYLKTDVVGKNLADELRGAESDNVIYRADGPSENSFVNNETVALENRDSLSESQSPVSSGTNSCEGVSSVSGNLDVSSSTEQSVYNSVLNSKMEIEKIIAEKEVYNSVLNSKMEIEKIIAEKEVNSKSISESSNHGVSNSVFDNVLHGQMEVEGILNEVLQNQHHSNSSEPANIMNGLQPVNQKQQVVESSTWTKSSDAMQASGHNPAIVEQSSPFTPVVSPDLSMSSLTSDNGSPVPATGIGARPKDPAALKKNRPSSLHGLSKINLDHPVTKEVAHSDLSPSKRGPISCGDSGQLTQSYNVDGQGEFCGRDSPSNSHQHRLTKFTELTPHLSSESHQRMDSYGDGSPQESSDSSSSDDQASSSENNKSDNSGNSNGQKMKRPTSLNLPVRPGFADLKCPEEGQDMETEEASGPNEPDQVPQEGAEGAEQSNAENPSPVATRPDTDSAELAAMMDNSAVLSNIGEVAPFWIPDADAESCMMCQVKFTMWKRRHHCRACGKVLCSACCNQKAYLPYMDNKEARVCQECHCRLNAAFSEAPGTCPSPRCPNPNNPNEYCSKVPPNQQASGYQGSPPVVMVPTGVLKTSGSQRKSGEPKQVMFSDGIRPGGDLTELDGPDQSRSQRRSARAARRAAQQHTHTQAQKIKEDSILRSPCLVPEDGFPPLYIIQGETGYVETDETLNQLDYTSDYKAEGGPVISYAVNKNLSVSVKIVNLDCCVSRVCWCFSSRGMHTTGQSELVVLLELTEEERVSDCLQPPRDIFMHFHHVYEEALKGTVLQDMGHTIFCQNFLGNREHGGFLYIRPTFQCLNKIPLPEAPYLFGILLQKWEAPWAKVFPIRLTLRLGAEFRYYPCPLFGVRNRKPVFYEIGHTIMNLLADFRNFQYALTQVRGVSIHMEDKKTVISLPRNRYNDLMKVVRNSNEHVMAFGSSFSSAADSHLVCIQNEEGNYQTQAINIQNKPRLVTGASFVVFNGALKTSAGLRAKSSIVEDGVMVQVLPEAMASLKQALKDMTNYTISCGPVESNDPEEVLELRWCDSDKSFNIGVKSSIDGASLEGVESITVKSPSDFLGENLAIRWTTVYFLQQEETSRTNHFDPMDLSRLTEEIAQACCMSLVKHLDELRKEEQVKLGLRVNLTRDSVGYEIGSKGQPLPASLANNLDAFLVPIIHQASEEGIVLEFVFSIID